MPTVRDTGYERSFHPAEHSTDWFSSLESFKDLDGVILASGNFEVVAVGLKYLSVPSENAAISYEGLFSDSCATKRQDG